MKTIYIDILLLTNFAVNLAFLSITKKITHGFATKKSILLASVIGSFSSLVILFSNSFLCWGFKILLFLLEIIISFKEKSVKKILKISFVLLMVNITYYGLCIIFWNLFNRKIFYINNLTVYFDIDVLSLIFLTTFFYVMICGFEFVKTKYFDKNKSYVASFCLNEKEYSFDGVSDTANNLVDLFYNKPVAVVLSKNLFTDLSLDKTNNESFLQMYNLHVIPCKTVNSNGIIYVTKPMKIQIKDNTDITNCEVCIGISDEVSDNEKCIFNPKILF